MSHSLKAQRAEQKREPVEFDDDKYELLMQCINSGQVEAVQLVRHFECRVNWMTTRSKNE